MPGYYNDANMDILNSFRVPLTLFCAPIKSLDFKDILMIGPQ